MATLQTKLIAIGLAIAALGSFHYVSKNLAVSKAKAELTAKYEAELTKQKLIASQASLALKDQSEAEIRKRDEEINSILAERDALAKRLRNRASRPQVTPKTSETPAPCTGAQLFREDGEFLVGEAARADKIVKERDYYFQEYENARKKLEELSND